MLIISVDLIHFLLYFADRAHRIGQASAVNVYFLHVRSSVDEIIWAAIQNKLDNIGQALDGQDRGMEVTAARNMPERGQKAMDSFMTTTQAHPQPLPLHPVQPAGGLERPDFEDVVDGGSPGKQAAGQGIRAFFPRSVEGGTVGEQENIGALGAGNNGAVGAKRPRGG